VAAQQRGGRVLTVFQPHLFSRTRDFAEEFATALEGADRAWVLPVHAAREDPDPTIDARTITRHASAATVVALTTAEEIPALVHEAARPGDLVLMLGAGDIDEITPAVLSALDAPREEV